MYIRDGREIGNQAFLPPPHSSGGGEFKEKLMVRKIVFISQ
jgi:hypothetical protein